MLDLFCPLKLTSVAASLCSALGLEKPEKADEPLNILNALTQKKNIDRVFMYNPDAVALWIFEKYTDLLLP